MLHKRLRCLQDQGLRLVVACLLGFLLYSCGKPERLAPVSSGQVVERCGVASGPQAVIEGGKPGKGIELGGVQGAGGPATAPEQPARPAEPPPERPQPPGAVEHGAESERPLPMLPNGEVGVVVDVPPLNKPNVNPTTTALFEKNCKRLEQKKLPPEYEYQRRMLGESEIIAKGGGVQVEADGINIQEGYLQDAKFVKNPQSSLYLETSKAPPHVLATMMADVESLFSRYGKVIQDPNVPLKGLEVITNDRRSFPFFEKLMKKYNIPGRIVEKR